MSLEQQKNYAYRGAWHHGKKSIYQKDTAIFNIFAANKIALNIFF